MRICYQKKKKKLQWKTKVKFLSFKIQGFSAVISLLVHPTQPHNLKRLKLSRTREEWGQKDAHEVCKAPFWYVRKENGRNFQMAWGIWERNSQVEHAREESTGVFPTPVLVKERTAPAISEGVWTDGSKISVGPRESRKIEEKELRPRSPFRWEKRYLRGWAHGQLMAWYQP